VEDEVAVGSEVSAGEREVEESCAKVGEGGMSAVSGSKRVTAGVIMWSLEEFLMALGRRGGEGRWFRSCQVRVGEVEAMTADMFDSSTCSLLSVYWI
jgi:hypothetical protein